MGRLRQDFGPLKLASVAAQGDGSVVLRFLADSASLRRVDVLYVQRLGTSNRQLTSAFNRFESINNAFRHRPRRMSKPSPAGNEDNAATPDMDIVRSVAASITSPSIDFDFSVGTSSEAEMLEPVAEESTAPPSSSLSATQRVESILVTTAASVLSEPR
jgi:hypothetical protein